MTGTDLQINIDGHSFIIEDDNLDSIALDALDYEDGWMWWV